MDKETQDLKGPCPEDFVVNNSTAYCLTVYNFNR